MKEVSKTRDARDARDDWQVIQQSWAAIVDLEQLRTQSLQVLYQSSELLLIIDKINGPLIDAPRDGAARSIRDLASPPRNEE